MIGLYYLFIFSGYLLYEIKEKLFRHNRSRDAWIADDSTPKISIIIPVKTLIPSFKDVIEKLGKINYPKDRYSIIVVTGDVNATKGSLQEAMAKTEKISIIQDDKGIGKGHALNRALEVADGEIVVFFDSDNIVDENCVALLVSGVLSDPETYIASIGTIKPLNSEKNDITKIVSLEYSWYYAGLFLFRKLYNLFIPIPGRNFAINRDILHRLGNFSEKALAEDLNLTRRIYYRYKHPIKYIEKAIIYEEVPDNLKGLYVQRMRWGRGAISEYISAIYDRGSSGFYIRNIFELFFVTLDILMPVVSLLSIILFFYSFESLYLFTFISTILLYIYSLEKFDYPLYLILYLPFTAILDFFMIFVAPFCHIIQLMAGKREFIWQTTPRNRGD